MNQKIIDKFKDFDFAETKRYAFVHSMCVPRVRAYHITPADYDSGGSNTGDRWRRTGCTGLGRAVKTLGLASKSALNIDYVVCIFRPVLTYDTNTDQTSSMGSLNSQFLRVMYLACQGNSSFFDRRCKSNITLLGDDGLKEYNLRALPMTNPERKRGIDLLNREALAQMKIYFPSDRTAREAHDNPTNTAGTICFNPKWWSNDDFPRSLLRDCESERGILMHNKVSIYPCPQAQL